MKAKNKLIKLTACLLMGACAVSAGIGSGMAWKGKDDVTASAASPNTCDEFLIGSWISFYDSSTVSYDEQLKDLARSGINYNPNPLSRSSLTDGGAPYDYSMVELNEMYKKYNMYFAATGRGTAHTTMDEAPALINEVVGNNLSHCNSYHVKDEPSAAVFDATGQLFLKYLEEDPDRFPYVNLFPNYAGASNLGGTYGEYVQNWVDTIGVDNLEYLAYDHYPFTASEDVRSSYFSDLETVRRIGYDNGKLKTMACTQLGSWNGMRRPTMDEARWNCNTFIAYGMKSLMHFNWVAPAYRAPSDGGEGMQDFVLTSSGGKTDLYEPMQVYNWQIRQLGPLLMQMDVAHAYHVGTVAQGVEALPKSFLLQPSSSSDNMIFSLAYGKNGEDIYVMVFNNEIRGNSKKYTINVDKTSGVKSLTRYLVDDFDTLPEPYETLPALGEETVDVSEGKFTVELKPGDIAVYKLNGNVTIREPLKAPRLSHKSGTYLGEQTVEILTMDPGAEIYYTTDGSYPTYASTRYTGPIKVGNGRNFGLYSIKAIAVRGTEISDLATGEYVISDGSENVALNKPVSFTGETEIFQGLCDAGSINNGNFDPLNTWCSVNGSPCFAIVDFGDVYSIEKVVVKAWHDWTFDDVIIQTALDKDFTQGVYTVFNNDTDNSVGVGAGSDGAYTEVGNGHMYTFSPVQARYIRFHNKSISYSSHVRSMWEEIQAYTSYSAGTELLSNSANWKVTGGGTWSHSGTTVSQSDVDGGNWNRSYTYTAQTFKNFILEGKFTMNISGNMNGYVGVGLYKPSVDSTQGNYDHGYYAVVEPRGRVLLWNGAKPELGPEDANIANFALGTEFTLRVVSVEDMVSISVNGKPLMYVRGDVFDRDAGYISIHSGLVPITVTSLKITELGNSYTPIQNENCLASGTESQTYVERFLTKQQVIDQLPKQMYAKDGTGTEYLLDVEWSSDEYDCGKTGYVSFIGTYVNLPNKLINEYGITAKMNVFVRPEVDTSELEKLIELAYSLNPDDFTAESFNTVIVKREAAEAMLQDPYLVQSDLGVGVFQLYDAIYLYLESKVDKSALETAIANAKAALANNNYTSVSVNKLETAIANAEAIYKNPLSSTSDVSASVASLNSAVAQALTMQNSVPPIAKPQVDVENSGSKEPVGGCGSSLGVGTVSMLALGGVAVCLKKSKKKDE